MCYTCAMNTFSPTQIKSLLAKYQAQPQKTLGQNFLIDGRVLDTIVTAANISKNDTVVEIGPGLGVLTRALAQKAGKVVAIEKDLAMINVLQETLHNIGNVEITQGDALRDQYALPASDYKLVANIPYYITSPLIRKFLESSHPPSHIILMVQKEVAQRICAAPPDMNLLAASVQFYATPKIIATVSKNCFWPAPKVDSAILSIEPFQETNRPDAELFFTVVKAGFSSPRKQLINNLSMALGKDKETIAAWLAKNGIQPTSRAETLTLSDWKNLAASL